MIRHGIAAKTDQSSKLQLELKDVSVKMTVGRKNKYFEPDSLDSDIIEEIIGNYAGIDTDVSATSVTHQEMVQYASTDWDFMLTRAEANGMLVFADDGKITVKAPSLDETPALTVTFGDNAIEIEAVMDARDQYAATKGRSWNFIKQELTELDGSDPGVDVPGNIAASELADVIGLAEWPLQHAGHIPDQELQAWIDARLLRSRLSKVRGRVKVIGVASIKPGNVIELAGMGDRFNGKTLAASVYHELSPDKKWYTHIEFGLDQQWTACKYDDFLDKPASGLVPAIHGLHQGIVTNIHEDPDGEGRVQVRIPVIHNEEDGVWARVATLDGGLGDDDAPRGTFFFPEVGDEVVVGFFNDDRAIPWCSARCTAVPSRRHTTSPRIISKRASSRGGNSKSLSMTTSSRSQSKHRAPTRSYLTTTMSPFFWRIKVEIKYR
ncbi:MAG: type VI secretion system tip protein VgrG [Bacteroidia bacterium]|nr:type VI secretion system tip protein VgrG [Bacteroidia bacterium]